MNRLLKQLEDLEELKGELDEEEYEVTKQVRTKHTILTKIGNTRANERV